MGFEVLLREIIALMPVSVCLATAASEFTIPHASFMKGRQLVKDLYAAL